MQQTLIKKNQHSSCTCMTLYLFSPIGRIPLDPRLTQSVEEGKSFVDTYRGTPTETAVADIVQKLLSETDGTNKENDDSIVRTT